MGQKPDDIAREIADLRQDTDYIVDELIKRVEPSRIARDVTGEVSSTVSQGARDVAERAEDVAHKAEDVAKGAYYSMPRPVRNYPYLVGGAALGAIASLGAYALTDLGQGRKPTTQEVVAHRLRGSVDRAGGTIQDVVHQAQRDRHVWLDIDKGEPEMVKRLMWVAMASTMAALGSMLFRRLSVTFWRSAMHEEPPKKD